MLCLSKYLRAGWCCSHQGEQTRFARHLFPGITNTIAEITKRSSRLLSGVERMEVSETSTPPKGKGMRYAAGLSLIVIAALMTAIAAAPSHYGFTLQEPSVAAISRYPAAVSFSFKPGEAQKHDHHSDLVGTDQRQNKKNSVRYARTRPEAIERRLLGTRAMMKCRGRTPARLLEGPQVGCEKRKRGKGTTAHNGNPSSCTSFPSACSCSFCQVTLEGHGVPGKTTRLTHTCRQERITEDKQDSTHAVGTTEASPFCSGGEHPGTRSNIREAKRS